MCIFKGIDMAENATVGTTEELQCSFIELLSSSASYGGAVFNML